MDWFFSTITGVLGWTLGFWQRSLDHKSGIEEGARAAFNIEHAFSSSLLGHDRQRLQLLFENLRCDDSTDVASVAPTVGEVYYLATRRDAFEACRLDYLTESDRAEWKRAFGHDMPPVSYAAGYLQAVKDVISRAAEAGPKFFASEIASALVDRIDKSQRKFVPTMVLEPYLESYDPDGKSLGLKLVQEIVARTFERAQAEQVLHVNRPVDD